MLTKKHIGTRFRDQHTDKFRSLNGERVKRRKGENNEKKGKSKGKKGKIQIYSYALVWQENRSNCKHI